MKEAFPNRPTDSGITPRDGNWLSAKPTFRYRDVVVVDVCEDEFCFWICCSFQEGVFADVNYYSEVRKQWIVKKLRRNIIRSLLCVSRSKKGLKFAWISMTKFIIFHKLNYILCSVIIIKLNNKYYFTFLIGILFTHIISELQLIWVQFSRKKKNTIFSQRQPLNGRILNNKKIHIDL